MKKSAMILSVVMASQMLLGATGVAIANAEELATTKSGNPSTGVELATTTSANPTSAESKFQDSYTMNKIASFSVGMSNEDGGVAEIVKYNKDNGKFYVVNGSANPPSLEIVSLDPSSSELKLDKSVLVKELSETNGFAFGDLTSVTVNRVNKLVYVAVQAADSGAKGKILALSYDGELVAEYEAGVQPDMIISTTNGKYVLTADEAEPRTGVPGEDGKGSVTIVNTEDGTSVQVYFDNEDVIADDVHIRGEANADGIIDGPGTKAMAVYDFEPEYITLSEDNGTAYVTLQENNAIAAIDIANHSVKSVKSLGLKDYNDPANALDLRKDKEFKLENVPFYGLYMPDGIASYSVDGKTYLLTANEGDATEWPNLTSAGEVGDLKTMLDPDSEAYKFLQNTEAYDGVEAVTDMGHDGIYMYGGRSFSIWDASSMEQVYDSGSDFEQITYDRVPDFFNTSNSKAKFDDRSEKKGPEPEDVQVGVIGGKTFAFVGLERVGGVMMYDITDPMEPKFASYVNSRVFETADGEVNLDTDTGPEGMSFISASDSPTGKPLLLVAFEVGGKVGVYEIDEKGTEEPSEETVEEPVEEPTATTDFTDIDSSYAKANIEALAAAGILNGVGEGKFMPMGGMTRADFTLLLSRLADVELEAVTASSFSDVAPTDYYAAAVEWASSNDIVQGSGEDKFEPRAGITREQMATMIMRYAAMMGIQLPAVNDEMTFEDAASIHEYAADAVAAMQTAGIINGRMSTNGSGYVFAPQEAATREQTAKMIALLLELSM
ncbi:choice-of-anchor I family protein [Paenibacillus sp. HB172176]|uniref:choice-of-anchor I family protein n=1 Tax=Paenibacillus sp. HB172176 TaxID=2493690 RepID=UPI00143A96D0|nr:choice-of-anchor I family protein [Paenibacillus sp. HB172176]